MSVKPSKLHGMKLEWKRQFLHSKPTKWVSGKLLKLEKSNTGGNTDIIHRQLLGRFGNVLSESQEEELKKHITDMDRAFYGLTIMDITVLVF